MSLFSFILLVTEMEELLDYGKIYYYIIGKKYLNIYQ